MDFMEGKKNYGIPCFRSLGDEFFKQQEGVSMTLRLNAAIAMFLLSRPEDQEKWINLVQKAERTGHGAMIDRLRTLTGINPPAAASVAEQVRETRAALVSKMNSSQPSRKAAS